jgi:diketogulonate reductase-like aldo/keto reductase
MTPIVEANGAKIPAIGLGTWRLRGGDAIRAVTAALDAGYRHIDTAAMYGNESEIGEALRTHKTPRGEIFVTTKVWPTDLAEGKLQRSAEASLKRLGLDQVDLLLIHWPSSTMPLVEQVRALCGAAKEGLTRHVGVSNFPAAYVEAAVRAADRPIVTNQVEHHPYLDQSRLFSVCRKHGVSITSYAPLGRQEVLADRVVARIAAARERTPAQIVLCWHVQQPGNIAIPKSADPRRIAENLAVFDFALSAEEMAALTGLARPGGRMVDPPVPLLWQGSPP